MQPGLKLFGIKIVSIGSLIHKGSTKKNWYFFLGIFPKPMDLPPLPPSSVHLGIKMEILAKFRNTNVNFMAKNNGHQNFIQSVGIPTPPLI